MRRWRRWTNTAGDTEVVKVGWSWPGCLLTVPWLIYKHMWVALALLLSLFALMVAVIVILDTGSSNSVSLNLLLYPLCLAALLFGLKGNKWYERQLRLNAYHCIKAYTFRSPGRRRSPSLTAEALIVPVVTAPEPAHGSVDGDTTTNVWRSTEEIDQSQEQAIASGAMISPGAADDQAPASALTTEPEVGTRADSSNWLTNRSREIVTTLSSRFTGGTAPGIGPVASITGLLLFAVLIIFWGPHRQIEPVADAVDQDAASVADYDAMPQPVVALSDIEAETDTPLNARVNDADGTDMETRTDRQGNEFATTAAMFAGNSAAFVSALSDDPEVKNPSGTDADDSIGLHGTDTLDSDDQFVIYTADVSGLFYGVTETLHAITDTPSAEAAVPHLKYINAKAQDLVDLLISAPYSAEPDLKAMIDANMPVLKHAARNASTQPGVGSVIDSIVSTLALSFESISTVVSSRSQASTH